MKKIVIIVIFLWILLILADCTRLHNSDIDICKPLICLYEDRKDNTYYGLGYSCYTQEEINQSSTPISADGGYLKTYKHFKLLYTNLVINR